MTARDQTEEPLGIRLADFVVAQLGEDLRRDEGLEALGAYVPHLRGGWGGIHRVVGMVRGQTGG